MTLPPSGPKVPAARVSVSANAVGTSSSTETLNEPVLVSLSLSVTWKVTPVSVTVSSPPTTCFTGCASVVE